jgi:hypothetical protein
MANLPLVSCTVPVNLPLTVSPSAWRRGTAAPCSRPSPRRSGNLALAQRGEKIAPVEDSAVPAARGVAMLDVMLAALVHGVAHLLAEAGRRKVGRLAMDQSPVHPRIEDEPVGSDPAPSQGGNPRLEEPHNLVERVFGSKVTGAGGDAIPLR